MDMFITIMKELVNSKIFLYLMAAYGVVSMFSNIVLSIIESVMFLREKRKEKSNKSNPTSD